VTGSPSGATSKQVGARAPGRRGRATRRRLLDAAAGLLETNTYRDLKVVDIARVAGTSPATFYQYFADVEDAVLALATDVAEAAGTELAATIEGGNWWGTEGWQAALDVADSFIALWERDRSILRVIDLATDEGDRRFREVRTRLLGAPAEAFVEVLRGRTAGEVADPLADAGVLVSMLAHVAAHKEGLRSWGADGEELRRSMARVVFVTVTGQAPSGLD
jgi:AcrR family transcriptional regulator